MAETLEFHFGNGDEVSTVPDGAEVLATSEDSGAVAIGYGGGWASVQFHPEASHLFFEHLAAKGIIDKGPGSYHARKTGAGLISNFLSRSV